MAWLAIRHGGFRQEQPAERWRHWQASSRCRECVIARWKLRYLPLKGGRYYRRYQIRTFWAFMPQGRLLPLSWMVDPCLRSARPFGLAGPLRATSALAVIRIASA